MATLCCSPARNTLGATPVTCATHMVRTPSPTPAQVAVLLVLTNLALFALTLLRFKQAPRKLLYLFASLVLALSACGTYRSPGASLYQFPLVRDCPSLGG